MEIRATTLGALLRDSVAAYPERTAMLTPPAKGKGEFARLTYADLGVVVRRWCRVLRELGLARGERLILLSENRAEWMLADWAAQSLGIVTVPIYPTLPADQARYIAEDAGARVALANGAAQAAKLAGVAGLTVHDLDEVAARAASAEPLPVEEWEAEIAATRPEDLATIIYTSGTTGEPKGAMIPHRAPVHMVRAVVRAIRIREDDVFLCILPISHVYERFAGQVLPIGAGAAVAYAKNLASIASDLVTVRPTVMLCVPRFLESFRDRVLDAVGKAPPLRQKLFALALSQGVRKAQGKFAPLAGLTDKLVMSKLRERTGGRMRFFVSGGAALAPAVAEFYMAMGETVLQGYGLTETCGGTIVNRPERNRYWTIGEPLDTEARIADDGELLLRGEMVFSGYWKKPEATAAATDPDGWFHTGDIAEWEDGSLKITDRKKDLVVLGNGKNVAPQAVENRLRTSPYLAEAVVFGDGMDHLVGLLVPNEAAVRAKLGLAEGVPLVGNAEVEALVKAEVAAINRTMAPFEAVKKWALLDRPFTIEGGELTPTLKVKRRVIRERHAELIASLGR